MSKAASQGSTRTRPPRSVSREPSTGRRGARLPLGTRDLAAGLENSGQHKSVLDSLRSKLSHETTQGARWGRSPVSRWKPRV